MHPLTPGGNAAGAPLAPINHQAAGITLGCATCPSGPMLKDIATPSGLPMWAKLLGVMALLGGILLILNLVNRK